MSEGYGRRYEYRVFSMRDDCPEENEGRRRLEVRMVWYRTYPRDYPTNYDIIDIDDPVEIDGATIDEMALQMDRISKACDKPALILAEWFGGSLMPQWFQEEGRQARARKREARSRVHIISAEEIEALSQRGRDIGADDAA